MAETVTISVAEYESLLETRRQFLSLKQALLAGGVTTETLAVLVSGICPPTPPDEDSSSINVPTTESPRDGASRSVPIPISRPCPPANSSEASTLCHHVTYMQTSVRSSINSLLTPECTEVGDPQEEIGWISGEQTRQEIRPTKRSLTISGLLPNATLHSLAQALKGGPVLQMFLRTWKRSAHVIVEWDDQQTRMQPSFTHSVQSHGRTRNLVIRFAGPGVTADGIRADLEHIHYLEIVDLFFRNGHAYISLNSIRSALAARSCMVSRLKYRKFKIDFYPDECDEPLPPVDISLPYKSNPIKRTRMLHRNRFELLYNGSEESRNSFDATEL
ncbi:hypothetical protein AYL99_04938 [Fonsecaea erecta]|uniref:RRM domain-containing protein n=1 Tax=Fonsecaea erecta TaxID=1367422 RepID=A0A178ZKK0_9EURO|nr:hypothetical protein AYL99_04938 [Fonsecaea erecta]OAP59936.1 hypothetical protein AYL99_04938 [Fonsecaea erecta]